MSVSGAMPCSPLPKSEPPAVVEVTVPCEMGRSVVSAAISSSVLYTFLMLSIYGDGLHDTRLAVSGVAEGSMVEVYATIDDAQHDTRTGVCLG